MAPQSNVAGANYITPTDQPHGYSSNIISMPKVNRSFGSELGEVGHNTLSDLALIPGAIGQLAGAQNNPFMQYAGRQAYLANQDANQSSLPQSLDQVNGVGGALGFGAHEIIQAAPVVGSMIAGAALTGGASDVLEAGALAAGAAADGSVAAAVNGGAEAVASKGATNLLARAAAATPKPVGAAAASYPLTLGAQLQGQAEASDGQTNLGAAAALSAPLAALNVAGAPGFLARGLTGVIPGAATNLLARAAVSAGKEALTQGVVGAAQQGISDVDQSTVNPNINPYSGAEIGRMAQAGAGNALLGGALGALGGVIHAPARPGAAPDVQQPVQQQPMLALPAPVVNVDSSGVATMGSQDRMGLNPAAALHPAAPQPGVEPAAPAPQPMLALPAPSNPAPIAVDRFGTAVPQPAPPVDAGARYAQQIQNQAIASVQPHLPRVQGAPGTQGDLFPGAARTDAAQPGAPSPLPNGAVGTPNQPDMLRSTPGAETPSKIAQVAASPQFTPDSILQQMRAAAIGTNGLKPSPDSFMVKLSQQVGTALRSGDVDAADAAIASAHEDLQAAKIGDSTLARRQSAITAAHAAAQEMRAAIGQVQDETVTKPLVEQADGVLASSRGSLDPAGTVPESPATLQAQQEQLVAGKRAAMLFPNDEAGKPTSPLALPKGMSEHATPSGTFHYNPALTSPDEINSAVKGDKVGTLLGLGPYSKRDVLKRLQNGESPLAVVERKPDGTEVRAAAGTDKTASEQLDHMRATADPENSVAVESVADLLAKRRQGTATAETKTSPRAEAAEAQGYVDAVKGNAAKQIVQEAANAHARGDATLEDVKNIADLAAARRYPAARRAADALAPREEGAADPVDVSSPKPQEASLQERITDQHEAAADVRAKSNPTSNDEPRPKTALGALQATHAAELADLDEGYRRGSPSTTKLYDSLRERMLARHTDELLAYNDEKPEDGRAVATSLRKVAEAAQEKGAITSKDHDAIQMLISKRDPESINEARALLAGAARRERDNVPLKQAPDIIHAAAQRSARDRAVASKLNPKDRDQRYSIGEPVQGMRSEDVDAAAKEQTAGWQGPETRTVQSVDDLPADVRAQVDADQAHNAKGIMGKDGRIYLIADNLRDQADVRATIFHEALGHYGLWQQFGGRLDGVLNDIYKTNKDIRNAADDWMSDHPGMYRNDPAQQARAVEEVLSHMAENNTPRSGMSYLVHTAMNRIAGIVRSFGRRAGLVHTYSNGDVARILRQAADRVTTGGGQRGIRATQTYRSASRVPTRDDIDRTAARLSINTNFRARGAVLKALTQRQIKEVWVKKLPELQTLTDLTARRATAVGEHSQRAADTLEAWRGLQQASKDSVSALLNKSRELQERAGAGTSLDREYNKLTPQERGAYDATLDYYSRFKNDVLGAFKKQVSESSILDSATKRRMEAQMDAHFAKLKVYVPYMREGDHVVIADRGEGEREVTQHKTLADAQEHAAAMAKDGYTTRYLLRKDYSPQQDKVSPEFIREMNDMFDKEKAKPNADGAVLDGMKSMANQLYLEMMPEGARARANMKSKGVAGYIADQERVLATAGKRNGFFMGALTYDPLIRHELDAMDQRAVGANDVGLQQVVKQERLHYAKIAEQHETPLQDFLNQTTYAYVLGGSPAFSVMHAMQTPLVSAPMMGAVHGFARAYGELAKAIKDTAPAYKANHAFGEAAAFGKTAGEKMMLDHLEKQGLIGSTESQQFLNNTLNRGPLSKLGQAVMHVATFLPHHTERFNRIVTALAEYRMNMADGKYSEGAEGFERFKQDYADDFKPGGRLAGMTQQTYNAMRSAESMIVKSHIDYAGDNAPYIMQKGVMPFGKLVFQFQKYQQGMLYELAHNFKAIFDSSLDKNERWVAARTLMGIIGTHGLVAGSMGLPGFGFGVAAADAYQYFFGDHDDPWEAETAYRNEMANIFGNSTADVIDRGILYAPMLKGIIPADITDRLGMGDLLATGRLTGTVDRQAFNEYIGQQLLGAAGSVMGQAVDAYHDQHEGNSWRAVEDLMPKALRDVSKAVRFQEYGINTVSGSPVVAQQDLTTPDIISQALGFQPQIANQAYASRESIDTAQTEMQDRKSVLLKKYTDAVVNGDDDAIDDAVNAIENFNMMRANDRQGDYTIGSSDLAKAVQARLQAQQLLAGGVSLKGADLQALGQYGAYDNADRGSSE